MMKTILRYTKRFFLTLLGLILILIGLSAGSNLFLPRQSQNPEQLISADKLRLMEAIHLRQSIGNQLWQGFAEIDVPILLYNEAYAFLIRYDNPPDGWHRVPSGVGFGGTWEVVSDDLFDGEPYYRQAISADVITDAFIVAIGERYVVSFPTYEWFHISLWNQLREDLPPVIDAIFPYRIATHFLINRSDGYIATLEHETFHALQAIHAPERFISAEELNWQYDAAYPWENEQCVDAWQTELDLLYNAVTDDDPQATQAFIAWRQERRDICQLTPDLIRFEQAREWVEGSAKYVELQVWRQGATSPNYTPLDGLTAFSSYNEHQTIWNRELDQLRRMADATGDGRFYYTGFTQAVLLDRYVSDWQTQLLDDGMSFDTLLPRWNILSGSREALLPRSVRFTYFSSEEAH